ncbi:MAG: FtsW/RodA/SpoVE family cell cycle protein [Planctomycetes bacterium]|nr:FtsW/RodA/SpoVE family cell cycle protein [Planctomycetota bacterium]
MWRIHPRNGLLLVTVSLVALGTVMIFSASAISLGVTGTHDPETLLLKQLQSVGLALLALVGASLLPYRALERHARPILAGAVALLCLTLIPGVGAEVNGARRWLRFGGGWQVQPSELGKLALLIFLSAHAARVGPRIADPRRGLLPAVGATLAVIAPTALAPDFGTSVFILLVSFVVLWVAGLRVGRALPFLLLGLMLFSAAMIAAFPHVSERLEVWLHPEAHRAGKAYQTWQSILAIGSGGAAGKGLGLSTAKQNFLPEKTTDFIYAIIGEELGLAGTLGVLALFALFAAFGLRVCARVRDEFGFFLALGIVVSICLQAAVNVAVVTGTLPNKGIALPLLSYSGSSLLFTCLAVGLLINIAGTIRHGRLTDRELAAAMRAESPFIDDGSPVPAAVAAVDGAPASSRLARLKRRLRAVFATVGRAIRPASVLSGVRRRAAVGRALAASALAWARSRLARWRGRAGSASAVVAGADSPFIEVEMETPRPAEAAGSGA